MIVLTRLRAATVLAVTLLLTACGGGKAPASAAPAAPPADPALAKLYAQTCAACHSQGGTAAPQAGSEADWAARKTQGMDVLVQHTLGGFKGMPPMGACADCSEDDFKALIGYMARMP